MDLFDLLIIAFILLPVLEGIFGKKARQKRKQGKVGRPGAPGGPDRRSRDEEAGRATSAGEMVPDDLWELLTGERRTRETDAEPVASETPESRELEEADRGLESWEADLEPAMEPVEYEPLESRRDEEDRVSEPPSDWLPGKAGERGHPPSEGYSLERTDLPEAYSLETPVRPERLRHAAFHRKLDALPPAARAHRPAAARDLGLDSATALRRAVILKEVLGPPKGLS